jgi:leucyl-tRNA synthetase
MIYDFKAIENKWQGVWERDKEFEIGSLEGVKNPYYVLEMFPYPSGRVHIGHLRNYLLGDVIARYRKTQGYTVLHPIGWDAFGLPAENAAIERKVSPKDWTLQNINDMKAALKPLGFSYDWSREIATCLPEYYKHQQKMFLDFLKNGLAYQKESFVNWDPVDNTVLANEQVIEGRGWRSGALVEKRKLCQWFFRTSDFAEALLSDLETLTEWPEKVRLMQKNWIGKSEGAEVEFKIRSNIIFETQNLVVRRFTKADIPALKAVHEALGWEGVITNATDRVERFIKKYQISQPSKYAIIDKKSGQLIGRCGFEFAKEYGVDDERAELGVLLHPEFQNKDFGLEVTQKMLEYGAREFNFKSVVAFTGVDNTACNKLLTKLGFTIVRQIKRDAVDFSENLYEINLPVFELEQGLNSEKITVFTTRPETLFGASFVAIAPNHPLAEKLAKTDAGLADFIEECNKSAVNEEALATQEKKGYKTVLEVENPFAKGQILPVYVANFVLMDYGTGAIFGCPGHDERDFEFATKYNLPIRPVISPNSEANFTTQRLEMRAFRLEDASDLFALHSDPEVMKYVFNKADSLEGAKGQIEGYMRHQAEHGFSIFAVFDRQTGEFVGKSGLTKFESGEIKTVEVSYTLHKKHWGKGLAREMIDFWLNYGFAVRGFEDIIAIIDPKNAKSRKIADSCKLAFCAAIERPNCELERVYYKINQSDFYKPFTDKSGAMINSDFLNNLTVKEAFDKVLEEIERRGIGKKIVKYRLRDWGISRQRYWGCPIPVVYCDSCGVVPEEEVNLPIKLPEDVQINGGENPLVKHPHWKHVNCPKCSGKAIRETDTMDTFVDSSWYFLRFINPHLSDKPFDKNEVASLAPVNEYIGGIEHAILHLLYARWFCKALRKCGYETVPNEPFTRLMSQGMVCHKTFKDKETGKWLTPQEALDKPAELVEIGASIKMSKSKKNVIEPQVILDKYGADTARFFILSDTPPEKELEWTDDGVAASHKFLQRFWNLVTEFKTDYTSQVRGVENEQVLYFVNPLIKAFYESIEAMTFNKSIAKIRELFNFISQEKLPADEKSFLIDILLKLSTLIIPHISCELWGILGNKNALDLPKFDERYLIKNTVNLAVQINGKMRDLVEIHLDASEEEAWDAVQKSVKVQTQISGKDVRKKIYVKNKIFNIIL